MIQLYRDKHGLGCVRMTDHTLYRDDSRHISDFMKSNSVDLIVTSPPYFLEKDYERNVSWSDHLDMIDEVLAGCRKALKLHHVICWNISHSPQRNVPLWHGMLLEKHFTFVEDIVWSKDTANSQRFGNYVQTGAYYPNNMWEHIFVYSKGKIDVKTNIDMKFALKFRNDVWDGISPQINSDHPAPFPEKLAENCIRLYSRSGDTVLDPFGGSGTTGYVASKLDRNSVLVERDRSYCELIKKRLRFGESLFNNCEFVDRIV